MSEAPTTLLGFTKDELYSLAYGLVPLSSQKSKDLLARINERIDAMNEPEPTTKFEMTLVFGESAVRNHQDGEVDKDKLAEDGNCHTYSFDTQAELDAFIEGVEAMDGWLAWCEYDLANKAEDEDTCDECGEAYDGYGDGFDGKCPDCADKAEAQDDLDHLDAAKEDADGSDD